MNPTPWLVNQGDVYWFDFGEPKGSEPGGRRPVVVIQGNSYNHSSWGTTVVAALTTRVDRATLPGTVFVPRGTGGLPRDSVVILTGLATVDKDHLAGRIGSLPAQTWASIERAMDEMLDRSR